MKSPPRNLSHQSFLAIPIACANFPQKISFCFIEFSTNCSIFNHSCMNKSPCAPPTHPRLCSSTKNAVGCIVVYEISPHKQRKHTKQLTGLEWTSTHQCTNPTELVVGSVGWMKLYFLKNICHFFIAIIFPHSHNLRFLSWFSFFFLLGCFFFYFFLIFFFLLFFFPLSPCSNSSLMFFFLNSSFSPYFSFYIYLLFF